MAATRAATSPMSVRGAKIRFCESCSSASRNMMNVPTTVSTISGMIRRYSAEVGNRLASTRHLRRLQLDAFHFQFMRVVQNVRVLRTDLRHEALRIRSHPDHQHDERDNGGPLARRQVVHMMRHALRRFSEKCALV